MNQKQQQLPPPEASPSDVFGQYLFGDKRHIGEPDTREEKSLLYDLESYFDENSKIDKDKVLALVRLMKQGKYLPVLQVPKTYKNAWRVLNLRENILETLVTLNAENYRRGTGTINKIVPRLDYDPLQSWSVNKESVLTYSHDLFNRLQNDFLVILKANIHQPDNTFILNPDFIRQYGISAFGDEREIWSVGPVHDVSIGWIHVKAEGDLFPSKNSKYHLRALATDVSAGGEK